ncbi:NUDIX hydrolase [Gulosibacter faecalis]|uniref:NUDIX domain-containing protein n=1 Tax=Gulosibacter faecalis TaxID=272240 RepID=A0ABW5UWG1_9MICO|nr:NUDIX domain-containing protein [Gulosibacter faecalis]
MRAATTRARLRLAKERFRVIPAAYVYLRRGDSVLLQLRQNTGFMDGTCAAAAAGHIEFGETASAAATREAREELGIELQTRDLRPLTAMQRTDGTTAPIEQRVDWFFEAKAWEGEPRIMEDEKCAAIEWWSMRELPNEMPPRERFVLERLAAGGIELFSSYGFGANE